jgi:hypothetical protein
VTLNSCSWWQAFSFLRLEHTFAVRGYPFLLVVLYMWLAFLVAVAVACVVATWGFMRNDFQITWVMQIVRSCRDVYLLDITCMTILFIPLGCQYYGVEQEARGHLSVLPDVCKCLCCTHCCRADTQQGCACP